MQFNAVLGPLVLDPRQLLTKGHILDNLGDLVGFGVAVFRQEGHDDLAARGLALLVELCVANIVEESSQLDELDINLLAVKRFFSGDLECWK